MPFTIPSANPTSDQADLTGLTSYDIAIPSNAKRITLAFRQLSGAVGGSNTQYPCFLMGDASGFGTTTYRGGAFGIFNEQFTTFSSFFIYTGQAGGSLGALCAGIAQFCLLDETNFIWVGQAFASNTNQNNVELSAGSIQTVALADTLRVTWTNGTNVYDSGNVNWAIES